MNTIPIEQIGFEMRLRKISQAQVERLAGSIADVGILHPITVYRRQIISDGRPIDGYGLVAGAHRVEACKRLGLAEIPAHVVELSDLERQIAECDENLCGPALTQSEKALFIRRRKDAYEALHPETRREATLKQGTELPSRQVGETGKIDRFTTDTAAKTGQSERAVQRAAERGAKISDKALVAVRGTKLDKGAYLDKLKTVPEPDQVAKVKADLASSRPPAKSETVEAVTRTAKRESTLRQRFADAISLVENTCVIFADVTEIPILSREDATDAAARLRRSQQKLKEMERRIRKDFESRAAALGRARPG